MMKTALSNYSVGDWQFNTRERRLTIGGHCFASILLRGVRDAPWPPVKCHQHSKCSQVVSLPKRCATGLGWQVLPVVGLVRPRLLFLSNRSRPIIE
ncbi:hypothetical protein V5799_005388 [Amblyomma americanum]|uniref:Uncharacterized protein n=1 Tax=Amblyomma americanum TaxID=6943 RepID=A0AAQ4DZD8_AMBAM